MATTPTSEFDVVPQEEFATQAVQSEDDSPRVDEAAQEESREPFGVSRPYGGVPPSPTHPGQGMPPPHPPVMPPQPPGAFEAMEEHAALMGSKLGLEAGPPLPGQGLQRHPSGIRSLQAPSWDMVEQELRQLTLTDFLRRMYDTICQQQKALEKLREMNESNNYKLEQFAERVDRDFTHMSDKQEGHNQSVVDRLDRIEEDLGLQKRVTSALEGEISRVEGDTMGSLKVVSDSLQQELAQNQNEKKTIRETVDELTEQHNKIVVSVMRERAGRMRLTAWSLGDLNLKGLIRRFYVKWLTWFRMGTDEREAKEGKEMVALQVFSNTRKVMLKIYYTKLLRFIDWSKRQHFRAQRFRRALRQLYYTNGKTILRRYWNKLASYLSEVQCKRLEIYREKVTIVERREEKAYLRLCSRFFNKLLGHRNMHVMSRAQASLNLNELRRRYMSKLQAFVAWQKFYKKRRMISDALAVKAPETLKRIYLEKWARYAKNVRRYLERQAICRALETKNSQLVRKGYYFKLQRYCAQEVQRREKLEQENRMAEMSRRTDNLGTQIDVGLKTLSNTNSVLNKLVDRLIAVDQQLDVLEKEKVGRRELSFITDPSYHPTLDDDPPPSPHRLTRHDPRTSPPPPPPPPPPALGSSRPTPMYSGDSDRQRALERERELERLRELQQSKEMEKQGEKLDSIIHELGHHVALRQQQQQLHHPDFATQPSPSSTPVMHHQPPPVPTSAPIAATPSLGAAQRPLVTPPARRASPMLGDWPSAEFARELSNQRAQLAEMNTASFNRFL